MIPGGMEEGEGSERGREREKRGREGKRGIEGEREGEKRGREEGEREGEREKRGKEEGREREEGEIEGGSSDLFKTCLVFADSVHIASMLRYYFQYGLVVINQQQTNLYHITGTHEDSCVLVRLQNHKNLS